MDDAAILALMGFATGLFFRLRTLLVILAGLLLLSIVFSISHGFGFFDTAWTIMIAQTVTQAGYFLGLVARALFGYGVRHIL
jgi:hypothetical protein